MNNNSSGGELGESYGQILDAGGSREWVPALARRQRSQRRKRRGPVMAAAKTWAGAWRGVLEGELVTATAIDHY